MYLHLTVDSLKGTGSTHSCLYIKGGSDFAVNWSVVAFIRLLSLCHLYLDEVGRSVKGLGSETNLRNALLRKCVLWGLYVKFVCHQSIGYGAVSQKVRAHWCPMYYYSPAPYGRQGLRKLTKPSLSLHFHVSGFCSVMLGCCVLWSTWAGALETKGEKK